VAVPLVLQSCAEGVTWCEDTAATAGLPPEILGAGILAVVLLVCIGVGIRARRRRVRRGARSRHPPIVTEHPSRTGTERLP
jgi:hypothetical protein